MSIHIPLALDYFKYFYSVVLLIFCVVLVMACIFTEQSTAVTYNINPLLAFFLFWFLICWLAIMEGGQGCIIGLGPIDTRKYSETHPITLKSIVLVHKGNNMERFIVGRQFLVVLVIFLINMCGSAIEDANPLGFPNVINTIFLGNGIAMMITTIDVGQLPSQVNAAVCMLDFINNYFMLFTVYVSLGIESSGLLHCVYLVQHAFAYLAGEPVQSNQPPDKLVTQILFWARVIFSVSILLLAFAVTFQAIIEEKSGMWNGVPIAVSIVIFVGLLCLVGLMEGMQIAAFTLFNMPNEELKKYKIAHSNCQLMFDESNLQSFLIGRQIFAAALMFVVARIATISVDKDSGETNIFSVPDGYQTFLDTGLLGAVILTIMGSLAWRVVASAFPLQFMSNPAIYVIIRICFVLEATGICSVAWILATVHKFLCRYKADNNYFDEEPIEEKRRSSVLEGRSRRRSVIFESSELVVDKGDDMPAKVDKMKKSFVTNRRYSSILLPKDMSHLLNEMTDDNETLRDLANSFSLEDMMSGDDDDDNEGDIKVEVFKEETFDDDGVHETKC